MKTNSGHAVLLKDCRGSSRLSYNKTKERYLLKKKRKDLSILFKTISMKLNGTNLLPCREILNTFIETV